MDQKHRQFTDQEQKNPILREKVFKALAKIHSLKVPINKGSNRVNQMLLKSYSEAIQKFDIKKEMDEYNCVSLKSCDLKAEIDYVLNVAKNSKSPVLFTHNDFRSSNLLITEPNEGLVVCDFDITGYGYRGFDFVSLSIEWGRKQFDKTPVRGIPFKDEEMKSLIEIYVEESVRIHGKSYLENEINSVDHILKELKIFLLFSRLVKAVLYLKNDDTKDGIPINRKVCMVSLSNINKNFISHENVFHLFVGNGRPNH